MRLIFGIESILFVAFWLGIWGEVRSAESLDPVQVIKQLEEAEQGNAQSQFKAGEMYETGKGVEKNRDLALQWYKHSADQGYVEAQSTMGYKYEKGELVPQDDVEAVKWYALAANQDDPWSLTALGYRKIMGRGSPKDLDEGIRLLHLSAEQNEPRAQYYLGICYRDGLGVKVDRVQAYLWLNLSAAQKSNLQDMAKDKRDELERDMIPAQIAEAQQLSTFFVSKKVSKDPVDFQPRVQNIGSGFFITEDGYLLTNFHVIENSRHVTVRTANGSLPAEVVKMDPTHDLALIKVQGRFECLPLGDSQTMKIGMSVWATRFPNAPSKEINPRILNGQISDLEGFQRDPVYFQFNRSIQAGNSGGALTDDLGNVVGVAVAQPEAAKTYKISGDLPKDTNFAVKAEFCLPLVKGTPAITNHMPGPNLPDTPNLPELAKRLEAASAIIYAWE